ncbi:hypothetical protein BDR06DRAFT_1003146 [Suillus hirtellus]|nr:hypothetical protein BDR06DRAFT_1003146 [Suillus hirtellus]
MSLRKFGYTTFRLNPESEPRIPIKTSGIAENSEPIEKKDGLRLLAIFPATMREQFGFPNIGAQRPEFQQLLIDTARKRGVEIKTHL